MVVLDTHALLWWSLDPGRLSPTAMDVCRSMEQNGGYTSSVSVWEIGIKVKRGKLEIGTTLTDYVNRLQLLDCLTIVPVDAALWVENIALPWEHRDPADRTIVATAKNLGLPILTKDAIIANFYNQTIW